MTKSKVEPVQHKYTELEKFSGYTSNINLVLGSCCFPDIDGGKHGSVSQHAWISDALSEVFHSDNCTLRES